jgi:hypothetical protein
MAKMISFNDKIDALLVNLKIEKPKAPKYIEHIYADFIEMNAFFLKDEVTLSDISDLLNDVKDTNIVNEEIDSGSVFDESNMAEINDKISGKIKSIFDLCMFRSSLFQADEYPFIVTDKQIKIKAKITDKQKLYLFLLISSNLNYFESIESILTKEFESLSTLSLKKYFPQKATVKSFGKNSQYKGNAQEKIKTLAFELGIKINEEKINCISKHNVQERGLDIVAWIPFEDKVPNLVILLGQCACGKNWDTKQADTVFFSNYFYFENSPIHCMFIPYSLVDTSGNFSQYDRILNNLFFDRKRIIEQFDEIEFFEDFESFKIIDKFIENRIQIN